MPTFALRSDPALILQIDEMRQYRPTGSPRQTGIEPLVHRSNHVGNVPLPCLKQFQNLAFPLTPVTNHAAHKLPWVFNRGSMRGVINTIGALI